MKAESAQNAIWAPSAHLDMLAPKDGRKAPIGRQSAQSGRTAFRAQTDSRTQEFVKILFLTFPALLTLALLSWLYFDFLTQSRTRRHRRHQPAAGNRYTEQYLQST